MAQVRMYRGGSYTDEEQDLLSGQLNELLEDPEVSFLEVDGEPLKQPEGAMSIYELNRNRLTAVKEFYFMEKHERVSWNDLITIDQLVSDSEVLEVFSGFMFVQDDFTI